MSVVGGDADIGRGGEFAAASDAYPADLADHGLRHALHGVERALERLRVLAGERAVAAMRRKIGDVGARRKRPVARAR